MKLCQECKKHCLPISFSEYITKFFNIPNEDLIVPAIEIDNGLFKRMAVLCSASSSGLSYLYSIKSEIMKQVYASTLHFHASSLYLIDIGLELIIDWYKTVTLWNKFLALKNEKCINFNRFLLESFKELVTKAIKVKTKLESVLSEKGNKITKHSVNIFAKIIRNWFYQKLENLDNVDKDEEKYIEFIYDLTSLLTTLVDVFIEVILSVDQMLTNQRLLYSEGSANLYLDNVNILTYIIEELKIEPREVRVLKPELLTIAKLNVAELNLNCKVYSTP